ncbi:MAG: DUF58 domain-containing protein [Chloroflexi bacterium]|nr:DUF58 domain-containing protein [Chloroflexota bacterium]
MLGSYWLFISGLLLIISLILHQTPLLLVSFLVFLVGGVARLWDRYCLSRVEYRRKLSSRRVFFGEEVQLEVEISNRKPLPLPWLQIDDEIPEGVTLLKGRTTPSHMINRVLLSQFLSLGWYHKIKRRYPLQCQQRGFFSFGPATIRSGDLFGLFSREEEVGPVDNLIVYPKIVPLEQLGIPSSQPIGDIITRSHIFQDPLLTQGIRDYHPGDSLRRIHWKTTARLGQLQTKVFEPTTTVDMGIFLDVRTVPPPLWGVVPELLELAIVVVASLAKHALDEGYRVGVYANQNSLAAEGCIRIPPSQHSDQLQRILETMAQVYSTETLPIASLVVNESRNLPWGSTMVVVTAMPSEALLAALLRVKWAGRRIALVLVGSPDTSISTDGLSVFQVRDDIMWRDLETLDINVKTGK